MSAQIIYGIDFRAKSKEHRTAEAVDFAAMEDAIARALWNNDAGSIGEAYRDNPHKGTSMPYDPKMHWPSNYRAPEKDPA